MNEIINDSLYCDCALNKLELLDNYIKINSESIMSTEYKNLDDILNGGIREGSLIVIGAISNLGKSSWCLQLLDTFAKQNKKVLYFSLEMNIAQLVSKSLSRESYIVDNENAIEGQNIIDNNISVKQKEVLNKAKENYMEYAKNIYFKDNEYNTIESIKEVIEQYITKGIKPIICIDYLQIIKTKEKFNIDKQRIDNILTELKGLINKYKITIILISSFNRSSYNDDSEMSSLKESGNIEYIADIIMTLSYEIKEEYKKGNKVDTLQKVARMNERLKGNNEPQCIILKVIKNRMGMTGECKLKYYGAYSYFVENEENMSLIKFEK